MKAILVARNRQWRVIDIDRPARAIEGPAEDGAPLLVNAGGAQLSRSDRSRYLLTSAVPQTVKIGSYEEAVFWYVELPLAAPTGESSQPG